MILKDLLVGTGSWLRSHSFSISGGYHPEVDDEGLIAQESDSMEREPDGFEQPEPQANDVIVQTIQPVEKRESIEKLQEGFNKLVEQLEGINERLNRQVAQHESLMSQVEQLPELLGSFPSAVENQKQVTQQLLERLQASATKDQQFIEIVEKIPAETAKQTDALVKIDHQLAASADTDVQMADSFSKFNETLYRLNQTTLGQTDGILQMSKTFAASDRHLKYVMSKQNKRLAWVFVGAVSVCATVVLILTGIIFYLTR
jgi:chromosome segregation ATPase